NSIELRTGHRRQRKAASYPNSSDRTIFRRLPNVESPSRHQRFASRNISIKSAPMPLYMDIHNLPEGTTPDDVAKAHAKDMEIQRKYGVEYHKYWVNEKTGKVFAWHTRQTLRQQSTCIVKRTACSPRRLSRWSPMSQKYSLAAQKQIAQEPF